MKFRNKWLTACLITAGLFNAVAQAEDIDIFTGSIEPDEEQGKPNVIFVLDNTSNWSRQAQQWPEDVQQGQSEVRAIKETLAPFAGRLNVGLVEYITGGASADRNAAYVRYDLQLYEDETAGGGSKAQFDAIMDKIFNDITSDEEKRDASNPYGDLTWDFHNYLSGSNHSNSGAGTTAPLADEAAYTTQYSVFDSPLVDASGVCADTYLIFIGNNAQGAVAPDDAANTAALKAAWTAAGAPADEWDALYGDSGTPLKMPEFEAYPETLKDTVIPAHWTEGGTIPGKEIPASDLGQSQVCYNNAQRVDSCTAAENSAGGLCVGQQNCYCTGFTQLPACGGSKGRFTVHTDGWTEPEQIIAPEWIEEKTIPGQTVTLYRPKSNSFDETGGLNYNFDDWAKFLHDYGIPRTVTKDGETYTENVNVKTYVIDAFNAQQSAELSSIWFSAAINGGGRYFQARNEEQIKYALSQVFDDIVAKESSFSAVSLPLSATNRARVENQLYIGMFRPAEGKEPRWFGNLKRYQLALFDGIPRVADVRLREAINSASGFPRQCAESFWTHDSGDYWKDLAISPSVARDCSDELDADTSVWSDLPDGPFVEKGGVAQQIRELVTGSERNILTVGDGGSLRPLATTDAGSFGGAGTTVYDYFIGDALGLDELAPPGFPDEGLRPSVHGDVVHSRPLSIRQSASDVTIYVGANDGLLRAIDPVTGTEKWALVAPEHMDRIERLYANSPLIRYTAPVEDPDSELKDYFFDGPTGQMTGYDDANVLQYAYIFPTMRRGGRMVYALDVTDPDADPTLMWRIGCPSLDNDTGCTTGFTDLGSTWSTPLGGAVEGYDGGDANPENLVVAFGGGFDDCLNANVAVYPAACSAANGKGVYILDAKDGELLAHLPTDAPVVTELAPIDINFDGFLDFLYVADVAGNLYRVNFISMSSANPEGGITALPQGDWTIEKIAFTSNDEIRFFNSPVAGAFQGTVIITIGTGDRERPLDINYPYTTPVQNRFYAFFDEPYKTIVADPNVDLEPGETHIIDLDGDTMYAVVAPDPDATPVEVELLTYDGWYMDLPDRGEQTANPAAIAGGKVFFNTYQPGGTSLSLCSEPLGIGKGYTLNLFDPDFTQGVVIDAPGLPIPPVIATVKIPPGLPPCAGDDCEEPAEDPCATGECEIVTVCIGCEGFEPVEIVPDAPPLRQRVFFTEDIDRDGSG